ncbi:NADH dehydrogenase [Luteibacter sp. Sphag1AF]|uniref:complex I NDUFA9 subunit family protein n=1 Tax=Luteibacter sp. Sphag1AF TaxID=2587031 RepID=UPI00160C69E0|nr:complex I NDUFA9 subunit family protein [Luteibacter sp. Sphag1AF]MBB3226216.1 NADH dehydrogenase [Luteibacter sp. Sphag1AF]
MKPQRIVILGGTGFVGSTLVPRLAAEGHQIVLLSRNRQARRQHSVAPGVMLHTADIYDAAALRPYFADADTVINLVGILNESGSDTFQRAHVELTQTVINTCRDTGVRRLHQMSSLKAGQGLSKYLKTRGEAESLIKHSGLDWTLYEPSTIFGPGDGLVTRFAGLLKTLPVMPLARPRAKMAPVYVGDVAEAMRRCIANPAVSLNRSFELYGRETLTLLDIVRHIRDAAGLKRVVLPLPDSLGMLQAEVAQWMPGKPFTPDNFRSLRTDSVGKTDGLAMLGIQPQSFTAWLPRLLGKPVRQRRLDDARSMRR